MKLLVLIGIALPLFAQSSTTTAVSVESIETISAQITALEQAYLQSTDAPTRASLTAIIQALTRRLSTGATETTITAPAAAANPSPIAPAPAPAPAPPVSPLPAPVTPQFPGNFVFLGVAYNQQAVGIPNLNAVGSYGKRLNTSGLYSFTSYDVYFLRVSGQLQLIRAERSGFVQWIRNMGPVMLFAVVDGGVSQASTSTSTAVGGSFSGGGFGVVPIGKGGFAAALGARVVASTLAPANNKTAAVVESALTFSWGK
jgi:hypothetical protein